MDEGLNRLLARSSRPDPQRRDRAAEIAKLVRATLDVDAQATVSVQQLACAEPGCPPMETKIVILGAGTGRRWTIHMPLSDVDDATVRQVLTARPEGETA